MNTLIEAAVICDRRRLTKSMSLTELRTAPAAVPSSEAPWVMLHLSQVCCSALRVSGAHLNIDNQRCACKRVLDATNSAKATDLDQELVPLRNGPGYFTQDELLGTAKCLDPNGSHGVGLDLVAGHCATDYQPLNIVGALVDFRATRRAEDALHVIADHVAVPT